jgi:hypothetical protein
VAVNEISLISVVCICAEQTFTEGSAQYDCFKTAFTIAVESYVKSPIYNEAKKAINDLFQGKGLYDFNWVRQKQLVDIIKSHRLRMSPFNFNARYHVQYSVVGLKTQEA